MRLLHLSRAEAEGFYAVHRERPFFGSLTTFMASGPVVVLALEAPDAIKKWRALMGATDPAKADAGTLRKEFGASIENNATHGSDAPETAAFELGYFFPGMELAATRGSIWESCWSSSAWSLPAIGALMMVGVPFGRLPGDVVYRRGNATFYFPLVTSIVLSVLVYAAVGAVSTLET